MGNSSSTKDTIVLSTDSSAALSGIKPGTDLGRILVLGPSEVGKTCLIIQHLANQFAPEYEPTCEESYRKSREVDGVSVSYEIVDTSGREETAPLMVHYIRSGQGFIILYSVCDRKSFDKCTETYEQILRVKDADSVPMVLVGTKSDVTDQSRVVSTAQGEELAKQLGIPFFETSAKNRINIDEVFDNIIRQMARFAAVLAQAGGGGKK